MAVYYARLLYNANGGSGAPSGLVQSSTTPHVLKTFTISSTKPSRTYFNFLGWGSSSGSTSASYAPGGTLQLYTATEEGEYNSKTLYAVWQHQTAYVYYNANGGTGAPSTQSHWAGYSVTLSATVPTRAGYNFLGWATSASATTAQYQPNTDYQIYTTVTLYAVWQPASSKLSTSNGTLGSAQTISITRYVNTYTDTITYKFGSTTGTIATKTSAGSVSWTPPTSLASQIPNASTGTCTLTCTTYNGNTVVGTSSITVTLSVPQSLAPTVSVSYADTIAQCLAWGLLVQSRSKLAFSITASGQQGASIANYATQVNGSTFNSASFTTDVLLYNGSNSYSVTVTDSRGLKTVSTGNFTVVAYSNPSLTLTLCDRNDSDSEQVDIGFDFAVSPVSNNNEAKYRIDYKLKSSSTWTNGTVQNLGAYSGSISDLIANLDGGDEWDIRINVIDSFQTSSVESEVGVAGNILLNSRHNGGLGLLMKSQADNQLDIGKPTVHHGAVLEQFGSTVVSHSASGNYAKVCNFGHRAIPAPQSYTGNPVNFMASAGDTISALTTTLSPIQDLHGYDNPWPAGGGKNLFDKSTVVEGLLERNDGSISTNGGYYVSDYIPVKEGEKITFTGFNYWYQRYYDASKTLIDTLPVNSRTVTIPSGVYYLRCSLLRTNIDMAQVEYGSTATAYAPYSNICPISGRTGLSVYVSPTTAQADATTYSVDWTTQAGTVYGGTLDVVNGTLTVDRVLKKVSDFSWDGISSPASHIFRANYLSVIPDVLIPPALTTPVDAMSDAYKAMDWHAISGSDNGRFALSPAATNRFVIIDHNYSTVDAFVAGAGNYSILFRLATPLTYQLTPQTVSALIGQNYIWSSANENVSLTVQPNAKLAVDNALTLEWIRSSDSTPTKTTIRFNSTFGLDSFITDNGLCYMSYANDIWSFFVEKTSVDDIINILDLHNPWSNSDMTIDWEDSSVSTLPTGAVQAESVNTVITESGITGSWRYRKWSDGRIEIWGVPNITMTLTTVGVYHRGSTSFDLPFTLSNLEMIQLTAYHDTLWYSLGQFSNGKTINVYGYDVVDSSNYSTYVSVYVIGTI